MARKEKKQIMKGSIVSFEYYGNTVVGRVTDITDDVVFLDSSFGYWTEERYGEENCYTEDVTVSRSDIDHLALSDAVQRMRYYRLYIKELERKHKVISYNLALARDDIKLLKIGNENLQDARTKYANEISELKSKIELQDAEIENFHRIHDNTLLCIEKTNKFPYFKIHIF